MMDQKIRIRIADREHELKVKSPEEEERTRKSAAMLNRMIESFQKVISKIFDSEPLVTYFAEINTN